MRLEKGVVCARTHVCVQQLMLKTFASSYTYTLLPVLVHKIVSRSCSDRIMPHTYTHR